MSAAGAMVARDTCHLAKARPNALDRLALKLVRDPRDRPFVILSVQLFAFSAAATAVIISPLFSWWLAIAYWAVLFGLLSAPYTLMLHNTSHRRLYRREYRALNLKIPWVLGPFYGQTPDTYAAHHIGMHHPENNEEDDLSSTMAYRRDSAADFTRYFLRFFFCIVPDLTAYVRRRGRVKLLRQVLRGELAYGALVGLVLVLDWRAAVTLFIVPLCGTRFLMIAGNWAQHAFIDPDAPGVIWRNAITCVDCRYNRIAFNDGYHVSHHLKPNRHFTEHPQAFAADIERYVANDAVVFRGIDYFQIWLALMLKRHRWLARHVAEFGDSSRGEDELVALIRRRLAPIAPREGRAVRVGETFGAAS